MEHALTAMPLEHLGRYEIIAELGRGSMGVVYRAWDPMLDRLVAIKTMDLEPSPEETEAFERRFYREARSAGRLNHPNIVTIHDVGKTDTVAYIAMEFLNGQSLRETLDSGVVLPIERVVDIAAQVADGLAFAHENGIVHRDIKPPNIMVLDNGAVKITDFGIALIPVGSRTLAGSVFGSPKYMSPEQIVGRQLDGRSDVFSLGAVLYEMLTGFAPFFGGDLETLLDRVINEMPAAPTSRNKTVPAVFDYIVATALAKHPDDRYPTARAFAADLRGFHELQVPPSKPAQRTLERRALRRRKGEIPASAAAAPPVAPATEMAASRIGEAVPLAGSEPTSSDQATSSAGTVPAAASTRRVRAAIAFGVPAAIVFVTGAMFFAHLVGNRESAPALLPVKAASVDSPIVDAPASDAVVAGPTIAAVAPSESAAQAPAAANASHSRASSGKTRSAEPATAVRTSEPAARASARLTLAVSPWGEVYIDGRKRGISPPLVELRLAPGTHAIEIRNGSFAPYSDTIKLEASASMKIKYHFH